ncbi:MAG: deoxynucleoside kinase [Bacteroidota bacterium]
MQNNFIAIEGNIGSGKTSLSTMISNEFGAKLIIEQFADNPFLPKFYKDPKKYAFPLEMSFLAERYQQLNDETSQPDLFSPFIVSDYYMFKSLIFAEINLEPEEYELYRRLFFMMYKNLAKPDLFVYLHQDTDRLLKNIKKRGRSYEQDIQVDYLEDIHKGYIEFIRKQLDLKILVVDVSNIDFVENKKDYERIKDLILEKTHVDNYSFVCL